MTVSIIVAMSENRVIGRDGDLPWRLSADLRRFKRLTMGHHIVMGRKTYESIGRLLPGRTSVVVTRQTDYDGEGALVANSIDSALALAAGDDEVFVVGGAEIYRLAWPAADRVYLTRVAATVDGDTMLPEWSLDNWQRVEVEHHAADEKNEFDHQFELWQRASSESCKT